MKLYYLIIQARYAKLREVLKKKGDKFVTLGGGENVFPI